MATRQATKSKAKSKGKPATKAPAAKPKRGVIDKGLSLYQIRFAEAYASSGNGRESAIAAGYAPSGANAKASRMLADPAVTEEIRRIRAGAAKNAEVTTELVIREIALGAFSDITDFIEWEKGQPRLKPSSKLDAAKRRAIVEVSETATGLRIKLMDKLGSLKALGDHLGVFAPKKVEVSGPGGAPLGYIVVPAKRVADDVPEEVGGSAGLDDED